MAAKDALSEELEALQLALKTEEDGYRYFKESSERTQHPIARKFFATLADDEYVHIRLINEFYDAMRQSSGQGTIKLPEAPGNYRKRLKTIFEEALKDIKEKVPTDTGITEVYEHAMDLETKAAEYYKQRRDTTPFDQARNMYDWLFHFESEHYRMLSETLSYLQNPEQWHQEYEKSIFEG